MAGENSKTNKKREIIANLYFAISMSMVFVFQFHFKLIWICNRTENSNNQPSRPTDNSFTHWVGRVMEFFYSSFFFSGVTHLIQHRQHLRVWPFITPAKMPPKNHKNSSFHVKSFQIKPKKIVVRRTTCHHHHHRHHHHHCRLL